MDYPPTYETFSGGHAALRGDALSDRREIALRWLGVASLAFFAAGMVLTAIDIELSSTPLLTLALPDLEMTGAQTFGSLGVLALSVTAVFVLALFWRPLSSRRRAFGFAALVLWLAALVLAAVEVNTAFEATLATISMLNRADTAPDLTARLVPAVALWFSFLGIFLLITAVVGCRRTRRSEGA